MLYPAYKHDNQTITKLAVALVWSVQPECKRSTGHVDFPKFQTGFLLNGKRAKCLWRKVGPARRLTLPLQKGD